MNMIFESVAFDVDTQRRTFTVHVVRWATIGRHDDGQRWRFARGSLKYGDVKYVRLHDDHDASQYIGRAIAAQETDEGLIMTFKIKPGPAGDRALAQAMLGRKTGFSPEIEADEADIVRDPLNPGVKLVNMANLTGVGYVDRPAFDDSRLISMTASKDGAIMPETPPAAPAATPPAAPAVPAPTPAATPTTPAAAPQPVTFSAEQLAWMQQNGVGISPAAPAATPATPPPARVIGEHRPAVVTEPSPYRFDRRGNIYRGTHEFSDDVMAYGRGDKAAEARVMEFVRKKFDVVTTDVNELNMPVNRPDMYVDQRSYRYPVWEAINKGTLADITPFTFPKFNSASGLVGAHTEGTEPSSGTFTVTNQTVTPSAISGKAKITRETWDQGGNPQISNLIWRQMEKGWYEALEAAAVAVLDAASPTQIDLSGTPGLADDDLDQAITSAFAALQFVRGGFSMDNLFTQIDLYKALVAATDSNGRRLYPALGPANATGTVRSRFGAVDLNGIAALPAWALAATGTVAASSYLFDSEVVHGWASAPQRLDFNIEVANVYIGLWGYKATAISDITGVREIVYDPS